MKRRTRLSLAFWPLFGLLLPQALWVRKTARRFGGAPGPRRGSSGHGTARHLVGLGDSVIDGVGCSSLAAAMVGRTAEAIAMRADVRVGWSAVGQSGATTRQIRTRLLPEAEIERADFVIVSTGVNDVTALTALDGFHAELDALFDAIRARTPTARIAICGLPPMHLFPALPQPLRFALGLRARALDTVIEDATRTRPGVTRLPMNFPPGKAGLAARFAPDGYHPSESSCLEFGRLLAEVLTAP